MDAKHFSQHDLWDIVEEAQRRAAQDLMAHNPELGRRAQAVASYVLRFQRFGEAHLFSAVMLNSMMEQWMPLARHLLDGPSGEYADAVSDYLDAIIAQTASWPQPWSESRSAEVFQVRLHEYQLQLDSALNRQRDHLTDLDSTVRLLEERRVHLEDELKRLRRDAAAQREELLKQRTSMTTSFNDWQVQNASQFDTWLSKRAEELETFRGSVTVDMKSHETEAGRHLEEIRTLHAKVEKVVGATTSGVLAKDFGGYARQQFRAAVVSFAVGVILIVATAVILTRTFEAVRPDQPATWQWVALKLGLTLTIAGGASFCLALGHRFLRNSTSAKRVELELRAIGPFLADVDDPSAQLAAKVDFANRTFGQPWDSRVGRRDDETVTSNTLTQVQGLLEKLLAQLTKS